MEGGTAVRPLSHRMGFDTAPQGKEGYKGCGCSLAASFRVSCFIVSNGLVTCLLPCDILSVSVIGLFHSDHKSGSTNVRWETASCH